MVMHPREKWPLEKELPEIAKAVNLCSTSYQRPQSSPRPYLLIASNLDSARLGAFLIYQEMPLAWHRNLLGSREGTSINIGIQGSPRLDIYNRQQCEGCPETGI